MLDRLSPDPDLSLGDVLIAGVVRNERLRLPWFLTHHRNLGVDRFLLIDNASSDGTTDYLLAQDDVCLFHTAEPYSQSNCGVSWTNQILRDYAIGHWTLILDADELFIFPGFETTGLDRFLGHLDSRNFDAVVAPLLDMYPRGPLSRTGYVAGAPLPEACPYFDGHGYEFTAPAPPEPRVPLRGGPRHRLFWTGAGWDFPSPVLKKIPLVKWRRDLALLASTHILSGAQIADVSGILLHFKFLQDFAQAAATEARRQEHFRGARQYAAYSDVLSANPDLCAWWDGSVRFRDSRQLLSLGLMQAPRDYPF